MLIEKCFNVHLYNLHANAKSWQNCKKIPKSASHPELDSGCIRIGRYTVKKWLFAHWY
jgi:hypothetical protein